MKRDATIDIAKSIAIVGIVFGHTWSGMGSAGLIHNAAIFTSVSDFVYSWHLSVFAFCAGLFVQRGMKRDGAWPYARDRDLEFLWLYVIWSLLQGGVKMVTGDLVNSPTSAWDVVSLWVPDGQLWFFGWISLMMLAAAAVRPWASGARAVVSLAVALILSVALWGLGGQYLGTQGLALSVYFWVALLLRGDRLIAVGQRVSVPLALLIWVVLGGLAAWMTVSGIATPPTIDGGDRTVSSVAFGVLASTAGLVAVLALAKLLSGVPFSGSLGYLGRESLVIFVAHIIFMAGTRAFLIGIGVDSVLVQAAAGTVAGVFGPLILALVARRLRMSWLFAAPNWLVRKLPKPVVGSQ